MATTKSSKARKPHPSTKSGPESADESAKQPVSRDAAAYVASLPDGHPKLRELALLGRELALLGTEVHEAGKEAERRMEARRAEKDAREAAGITLKGRRLRQAQWTVAQVNYSSAAIHKLVFDAGDGLCDTEQMGRYLTAIENIAETMCRRCDVLAELLGERGGFGNLADDFEALTEERAAELEREEVEADHA